MTRHTAQRNGTPDRNRRGQLLETLVGEILQAFFDLRAAGQQEGLVNPSGAGTWGLLRLLGDDGPMTVPAVARMRSVSRQYIQKLANELMAEGWIEMAENPGHKRSKLMRVTPRGEQQLRKLNRRFQAAMAAMADEFDPDRLRAAAETIAQLRKRLSVGY